MKIPKNLSKDLLLNMFEKMMEIREFESRAVELFTAGELPGFLHSCLGQEAAAVGTVIHLRKEDYVITTHRGHGHLITKGTDMKVLMAELFAKEDGCCKGRGGSIHMFDNSTGVLGVQGIVGQGPIIASGAALAAQMKGEDRITFCFFGDGAQNEGFFHEALNFASIWDLPIVFICENNMYAESTSQEYHMRPKDVATRAKAYDMEALIADGNDVIDVYQKTQKAIDLIKEGKGPVLMESKTYRWLGHYVGDPGIYRKEGELDEWKSDKKEPITRFKNTLITNDICTEDELDKIAKNVKQKVDDAVEFSRASKPLAPESALDHVYKYGII